MLFISKKLVFSLLLGICRFNHAHAQIINNVSLPIIAERNCTHVTFSNDIQFHPLEIYKTIYVSIYRNEKLGVLSGEVGFYNGIFFLEKNENMFYNYTTLRVDPIPKSQDERFTLYTTIRFPDDRLIYRLSFTGHTSNPLDRLISPLKVGKSRCFPQDDMTGCDPYCVCDTVVQKKCQDDRSISGKCSYSGSTTDNSGRYTFNESCELSSNSTSSGSFSSNPSSSGSISSNPTSSGSFSSNPTSSGSFSSKPSSTGSFSSNPTSTGSFSSDPTSSGSFSSNPTSSGSFSSNPTSSGSFSSNPTSSESFSSNPTSSGSFSSNPTSSGSFSSNPTSSESFSSNPTSSGSFSSNPTSSGTFSSDPTSSGTFSSNPTSSTVSATKTFIESYSSILAIGLVATIVIIIAALVFHRKKKKGGRHSLLQDPEAK